MNLLPSRAKFCEMFHQARFNFCDLSPREPIIFTKLARAYQAIQIEDRFTASPNHMNMGGSMIVWINRDAQLIKSQDRWHYIDCIQKPKRLGFY